ncbi:MAG: hypothetical protein M0D55_07670 [Elusimicrobiota bacterium]|nr:MAG: hypothetical protein M0D55_07670 [Elusimicrobiota bacterium]
MRRRRNGFPSSARRTVARARRTSSPSSVLSESTAHSSILPRAAAQTRPFTVTDFSTLVDAATATPKACSTARLRASATARSRAPGPCAAQPSTTTVREPSRTAGAPAQPDEAANSAAARNLI